MTNQLAIALGLLIALFLGLDAIVFGWSNTLFLAKKFADFVEWLAFWR
ncbi:glyceraldehyde-3-phosphate dehydrogenase [Oceanicola sp. 22II-s10i]|nr:hypothetical protein [Oceanicola sp. 22II-s10i]OWU83875.1 glyceraldehyde-3-phosphate dehydrogenase [Oceanicola sp. 22II-s10i]